MIPDLTHIAAPMVNQSDAPFRLLTRRYGATLAYTQMLDPNKLLHDRDYLDFYLRDLECLHSDWMGHSRPVVVQLCGNDPDVVVKAAKKLQAHCDAIDLNLGCPQDRARDGHFGGYLLGKKDWPLVESIVSAMSNSLIVPTSAKIRLCPSSTPPATTLEFGRRLEHAGASWTTLHARHVSARRRRQGSADLNAVRALKEVLTVPVVSNGNVRAFSDVQRNREYTRADGIMVGETLLGNPCLFSGSYIPDPVHIALEYLDICRLFPGVATIGSVQTHVRHVVEFQCARRTWYSKFRLALNDSKSVDDIETLLQTKVRRWRGKASKEVYGEVSQEDSSVDDKGDASDYFYLPLDDTNNPQTSP
ncbi:FMN-linked oxidoreductase [Phlebopus sp. FC_14]|nr:FMN-linked oxidoreductase [Phlebopus sp. FC_14]